MRIADTIHPGLLERAEVFAERVKLFPEGCLALVKRDTDQMYGFAVSHPIRYRQEPELDTLLEQLVSDADQYYIHDLAILTEAQGRGYAHECIEKILAIPERYHSACLVSVYGTATFWAKHGFSPADVDGTMTEKIRGYGDGAVFLERSNKGCE